MCLKGNGEELEFQYDHKCEDYNDGHNSLVMDDVLRTPCDKNHDSISK